MSVGDKFHAAETSYGPDEAEYDAAEYNYQIVDHSDDVIALFPDKGMRDKVLKMLNAFSISDEKHAAYEAQQRADASEKNKAE